MEPVHELFYIAAYSRFEWSAKHLTTDTRALTVMVLNKFRALAPDMEDIMTKPRRK